MVFIKFDRSLRHKRRPATNRRIAAAKRWINNQIEKAGLFAAEVAAEMPTPEERIDKFEDGAEHFWQNMRDQHARTWREARKLLRELPDADRCVIAWNSCGCPKDSGYFASHVRNWPMRKSYLDRPLSDLEERMLSRLSEALPLAVDGPSMTDHERLACFHLTERGLALRGWFEGVIVWRAVEPAEELAASAAD